MHGALRRAAPKRAIAARAPQTAKADAPADRCCAACSSSGATRHRANAAMPLAHRRTAHVAPGAATVRPTLGAVAASAVSSRPTMADRVGAANKSDARQRSANHTHRDTRGDCRYQPPPVRFGVTAQALAFFAPRASATMRSARRSAASLGGMRSSFAIVHSSFSACGMRSILVNETFSS